MSRGFCMVLHGEAQKHSFETKKPKHLPKKLKKKLKKYGKIALLGPFKGPCTLP